MVFVGSLAACRENSASRVKLLTVTKIEPELLVRSNDESDDGKVRSYPQLEAAPGFAPIPWEGRRHMHQRSSDRRRGFRVSTHLQRKSYAELLFASNLPTRNVVERRGSRCGWAAPLAFCRTFG